MPTKYFQSQTSFSFSHSSERERLFLIFDDLKHAWNYSNTLTVWREPGTLPAVVRSPLDYRNIYSLTDFCCKKRSTPETKRVHCDQMARLFFRNFAIYNSKNWPNSLKDLAKKVQNFDHQLINPYKIDKGSWNIAKVAKFCQTWSHWKWRETTKNYLRVSLLSTVNSLEQIQLNF